MAKFVYKMQSLLNIKEKLEEQEKTAYGLAKAALNEEEEKLAILIAKKNRYLEEKRRKMSELLDVLELARLEQAIYSTELLINDQVLVVKRAEKAVALAQIRLENAMKERKIQEKLREKALEEFKKEEEAKEQQEINELVTFRFGNQRKKEG
ncbi:MAG: flagellar export protein FliJ [Lachnospiraceae bacterium]|nr:flagellar export protein FliJ [Lachnospiraceae bacterium]